MPPSDPYKYFRIEAAELLEQLGRGVLELSRGVANVAEMAALFRYAHTLKGAARVVKQLPMADHAHAIEDLLTPHRASGGPLPREVADTILLRVDSLGELLRALNEAPGVPAAGSGLRVASAAGATSAAGAPPAGATPVAAAAAAATRPARPEPALDLASVRADASDVDAVLEGLVAAQVEVQSLRDGSKSLDELRRHVELLSQTLAAPRRAQPERLMSALQRAQRVAEDLAAGLRRIDRGVVPGLERLARELSQTHGAAERLRLVPARNIFVALERAAREVARELGKPVRFSASGGEIKLEGRVLALAQSALGHVVRNSLVHGIEAAAQRRAAGKPAEGSIRLSILREGRTVSFLCEDDGAGLDVASVKRELARQGRAAPELAGSAAGRDAALLQELLRGGVSTAQGITGLAGRGVGLDVLRDAAEQLGGTVKLTTEQGRSFRVELRLPLTVAAFEGVAVECDGRGVAIPLEHVLQSLRFPRQEVARSGAGDSIIHEGQVIPFAPLSRALGGAARPPPANWSALIVRARSGTVAVGVDRLLGARELVLRPLPPAARASKVVAGAALDALGNPELVLDAEGLVQALRQPVGRELVVRRERKPILIVDDSLTTRMLEQSILESAGYEVDLATSGEEGLLKAHARRYGMFLVDVEMPGIDGFTFIERAGRDPVLAGVPAVLVSSRNRPEDFLRGKSVGARGYIVKDSFDQRELLGLIHGLLDS
jgi:two-component system, chemotaxis family, sensor kinase CheA